MTHRATSVVLVLAACLVATLTFAVPRTAAADRDTGRALAAVAAGLLTYELLDSDRGSYGYYYRRGPAYCPIPDCGYSRPPAYYYDYRRGPWRTDYEYRPWSWQSQSRVRFGYEQPPAVYYTPRPGRVDRGYDERAPWDRRR